MHFYFEFLKFKLTQKLSNSKMSRKIMLSVLKPFEITWEWKNIYKKPIELILEDIDIILNLTTIWNKHQIELKDHVY